MKILVMGAGVIGVTTAYYLARDGHEVIVVDQHDQAQGYCEDALRIDPEYADAYYQLAFARRRLGDREGAAGALARFEELSRNRNGTPEERR